MPKKKQHTQKWKNEYVLAMRRINARKKQGFVYTDEFIRGLENMTPSQLNKLRGDVLTNKGFYILPDNPYGEVVTGKEGSKIRKQAAKFKRDTALIEKAAKKTADEAYNNVHKKHKPTTSQTIEQNVLPSVVSASIDKLKEFIATFEPQWGLGRRAKQWNRMELARKQAHDTIEQIYNKKVAEIGEENLVKSLKEKDLDIDIAINAILSESNSDVIRDYGVQIANAINGGSISKEDNEKISNVSASDFSVIGSQYEGQYRTIYEGKRHDKKVKAKKS